MYTKLGRVVAALALMVGVFHLALGVGIASGFLPEASRAYLGNKTTGETIDQSVYVIVFAIILGILTEISRSLVEIREVLTDSENE